MERIGRSKRICIIAQDDPGYLLIQPMDERDVAGFEHEAELIAARTHEPFALVGLVVEDWNRDLSPWEAPPVFGKEPFGDGASATLAYIEEQLVPLALERCGLPSDAPVILGGYSLAGLFALWSGYRTDAFAAIAAVSPSVWFPGWIGFAKSHDPLAQSIYLSLGDREEKAKNPVMAQVGDCIRRQHALLEDRGVDTELAWNRGNHFADPEERLAKGFAWCLGS